MKDLMQSNQRCDLPVNNSIYRPQIRYEEIDSNVGCVYLSGRLDISALPEIELKFTAMTVAERKLMIVDLSEVELITSDGLAMLLSVANSLKAQGKRMVLLKPNRHVEKVVRMACLDQLLPIEHNLADALGRIRAQN